MRIANHIALSEVDAVTEPMDEVTVAVSNNVMKTFSAEKVMATLNGLRAQYGEHWFNISEESLYVAYCGGHLNYSYEDYLAEHMFRSYLNFMVEKGMIVMHEPRLSYDYDERDYYYTDYEHDEKLAAEKCRLAGCEYAIFVDNSY